MTTPAAAPPPGAAWRGLQRQAAFARLARGRASLADLEACAAALVEDDPPRGRAARLASIKLVIGLLAAYQREFAATGHRAAIERALTTALRFDAGRLGGCFPALVELLAGGPSDPPGRSDEEVLHGG